MHIYRLTALGYALAHSTRSQPTPEWRVIHYLNKMHSASRDKIIAEVSGATPDMLTRMARKHLLTEEMKVAV